MKKNLYQPKSIQEAIDELQTFLEVDLYTKFFPKIKIKKQTCYRQDIFRNEKEFINYIKQHFTILKKQVRSLQIKNGN